MYAHRPYTVAAALLVIVLTGWTFSEWEEVVPPRANPELRQSLVVAETNLDLGNVWEEDRFLWRFDIGNRGPIDVEIERFAFSCACAGVHPASLMIPAGKSRSVELTLDLSSKRNDPSDESGRAFEVVVQPVVKTDRADSMPEWKVAGRVKPILKFSDSKVAYGKQSDRAALSARRVRVWPQAPLVGLSVRCQSAHFFADLEGNPSDGCYDLVVRPADGLSAGVYNTSVEWTVRLADGKSIKPRPFPIQLEIVPDVQAIPRQIHLGTRKLGETCTEAVTLTSLTGTSFEVSNVHIEGSAKYQERPSASKGNAPQVFAFSQEIAQLGRQTANVVFSVRAEDGKKTQIVVPLAYHGIAAK